MVTRHKALVNELKHTGQKKAQLVEGCVFKVQILQQLKLKVEMLQQLKLNVEMLQQWKAWS